MGIGLTMRIELMADYGCGPFYWDEPQRVGNVRPEEIGLTDGLSAEPRNRATAFGATSSRSDPAASGFASQAEEHRFHEPGRHPAGQVATEFGIGTFIRYGPVDRCAAGGTKRCHGMAR